MHHEIIIIGRVASAPVVRYMPSGDLSALCKLIIVAKRNGKLYRRTFKLFGRRQMAVRMKRHLRRGTLVMIRGALISDPNTGGPRLRQTRSAASSAPPDSFEVLVHYLQVFKASDAKLQSAHTIAPRESSQSALPYRRRFTPFASTEQPLSPSSPKADNPDLASSGSES
ncbi:MAG: single-stranded DNA-binding protein [Thermoflexales bacterium]|nr:single-stranded DNA-binding protein [Thermoflexales bacterium]